MFLMFSITKLFDKVFFMIKKLLLMGTGIVLGSMITAVSFAWIPASQDCKNARADHQCVLNVVQNCRKLGEPIGCNLGALRTCKHACSEVREAVCTNGSYPDPVPANSNFEDCDNCIDMIQEILPVSYNVDQDTDTGSYQYHDWTGEQLIDGEYGIAPWSADLGNGNAYEWLGWSNDPIVNIDFDFGEITQVDRILVGTTQDHPADVVLPSIDIYSGEAGNWTLVKSQITPESTDNNNIYRTYAFELLGLNTRYVRVTLKHSLDGPWTFVDEVDFFGSCDH